MPVIFDIKYTHKEILKKHGKGIQQDDLEALIRRYGEC